MVQLPSAKYITDVCDDSRGQVVVAANMTCGEAHSRHDCKHALPYRPENYTGVDKGKIWPIGMVADEAERLL